jgi:benzil reductase ((S)-benzoin forming)
MAPKAINEAKGQLAVVIGGTHGLGGSLSNAFRDKGFRVIHTSRTKSSAPTAVSATQSLRIELDLAQAGWQNKLRQTLREVNPADFREIHWINNAGVIEPIGEWSTLNEDSITRNLQINLIAPMLCTQLFLNWLGDSAGLFTCTNVGSGVAAFPRPYWAAYTAAKAGLRAFTEAVSKENRAAKVFFFDFSPGIMDTAMQTQIRSHTAENFPDVELFKSFKTRKELLSPDQVAITWIDFLQKVAASPERFVKTCVDVSELNTQP